MHPRGHLFVGIFLSQLTLTEVVTKLQRLACIILFVMYSIQRGFKKEQTLGSVKLALPVSSISSNSPGPDNSILDISFAIYFTVCTA